MLKHLFLPCILIFNFFSLSSQCLSTGLVINTQLQIDDFAIDYAGCSQVLGDITIKGINPNEITSLAGLNQISSIGGHLIIQENNALVDLSGLENLTYIGAFLEINTNEILTSFQQLSNLQTLDGSLRVFTNNNLSSLAGFENLHAIGGYMWIKENPQLTDLNGLNNISSISSGMSISANSGLTNLSGLENLSFVQNDCRVYNNAALSNINAMVNIDMTTVTNLRFYLNPNLSICGLQNVCSYLNDGKPAEIHDNDTNCNTISEILNNCAPLCSSLPTTLQVDDQPIVDGVYQAIDLIESSGTIPGGSNVAFKAGMDIILQPGFNVSQNVLLMLAIEQCAN